MILTAMSSRDGRMTFVERSLLRKTCLNTELVAEMPSYVVTLKTYFPRAGVYFTSLTSLIKHSKGDNL